jgi:hypothetical protein
MQPLDPATPLTVIMTAQEWNAVLTILDEVAMPKRVTVPLAFKIQQQLQAAANEYEHPRPPRLNGGDEAHG